MPPQTRQWKHKQRDLTKPFIQDLPLEILVLIFIQACRDSKISYNQATPLTVSSVCRLWRDLALDTPIVWSSIVFHDNRFGVTPSFPNRCPDLKHLLPTFKLYLKRSGGLPLQIIGDMQDAEYLDVFIRHSKRWRVFEIYLYQARTALNTLNKVKGRVPLLEELSLQIYDCDWQIRPFDAFEFAPALTNLTLVNFTLYSHLRIPWDQITEFTSSHATLSSGLQAAQRCKQLHKLTLDTWNHWVLASCTTLHSVRNLELHDTGVSEIFGSVVPMTDFCSAFLNITVPNLTSLTLVNYDNPSREFFPWPSQYFEEMVHNSQPFSLTTFSIRDIILDYPHLVECLKLLPFLETLTIVEFIESPENTKKPHNEPTPSVYPTFVRFLKSQENTKMLHDQPTPSIFPGVARALIWRADGPLLVPKLRALTLVGQLSGDDTQLVNMLESRLRSHPKQDLPEVAMLSYVHLVFRYRSLKASARERLWKFEGKDGLEIHIVENSYKLSL
jgi:F-box-like